MEFILIMLETLNNKLGDLAFSSLYDNSHDVIMELNNFFFYGIFEPKAYNKGLK